MTPFEHWWYHEGSGPPTAGNDMEEHCKRMCQIAWENGSIAEREACAKACEAQGSKHDYLHKNWGDNCAAVIRSRSNT